MHEKCPYFVVVVGVALFTFARMNTMEIFIQPTNQPNDRQQRKKHTRSLKSQPNNNFGRAQRKCQNEKDEEKRERCEFECENKRERLFVQK